MDYKVYARAENGIVKKVFMDWAEQPLFTDTLIAETADRHAANDYQIVTEQGIYTKTIQGGKLVDRDITADLQRLSNTAEIARLKALLASTDYQAIKYAEGRMTSAEYAPISAQRETWRSAIRQLEE